MQCAPNHSFLDAVMLAFPFAFQILLCVRPFASQPSHEFPQDDTSGDRGYGPIQTLFRQSNLLSRHPTESWIEFH